MDKSNTVKLIAKTYTADALGQMIATEKTTEVFCNVRSVTRDEFFAASEKGIRPEWRVTMFAPDYNDEETVEFEGKRYIVYRTYLGSNESLELYLASRVGA